MYRRPKELKYRHRKSRLHSANHQGKSGRTKLDVGYKDLSHKEGEIARWKCSCQRCQDGKRHKWKRQEKVDPFEGNTPEGLLDDILYDRLGISPEYSDLDFYIDNNLPYGEEDLDFCEEIELCLPEDYDSLWNYQGPCGSEFKGGEG